MKKKTVITTEKHEVWVIRQPADEELEQETEAGESQSSAISLTPPLDLVPESETPPDEQG